MTTDMAAWKTMRKTWVTARDSTKPRVASGAVKGVSVGGDLDAVYKGSLKGYQALHDALAKLVKDIDKYQLGIKAKNANLATWIGTSIETPAKTLLNDMKSDDVLLKNLYKKLNAKWPPFPNALHGIAAEVVAKQKPLKDVAPDVDKSLRLCRDFVDKLSQDCRQTADKINVSLAGHDRKALLGAAADHMAHELNNLKNVIKAFATMDKDTIALRIKMAATTDQVISEAVLKAKGAMKGTLLK